MNQENNSKKLYFVSWDDEIWPFDSIFNTRDEALAHGLNNYPNEGFYIGTGYKLNWHNAATGNFIGSLWESILENLSENHYEGVTEDLPIDLTLEEEQELAKIILDFCESKFKNPFGYQIEECETVNFHISKSEEN